MTTETPAQPTWTEAVDKAAQQLHQARATEAQARANAKAAALDALDNDAPEAAVARHLGVDRMTIRKWRRRAAVTA